MKTINDMPTGAEDSAKLIVTQKGHLWCEDIIRNAIDEEVKKW